MNTAEQVDMNKPPRADGQDDPAASVWLEQTVFLDVIRETVAEVPWAGKGEVFAGSRGQGCPAEALMRALTYAIATGLHETAGAPMGNIEDLNLWRLCDGVHPDWATLHEFCQAHRDDLKRCLAELFHRTVLIRFGDEDGRLIADSCVTLAWDRWFDTLCVPAAVWDQGAPPVRAIGRKPKGLFGLAT